MIDWGLGALIWLTGAGVLAMLASMLALRSWLRFAQRAKGLPGYARPKVGPSTPLDRLFGPGEAAHPGKTGVMGLFDNADAFAARAHSAQLAGRSLDVMTYIWSTDMAGWLLLGDVLAAADRGVHVRLLLDDVNVQGFDPVFLALSSHPNIDVRLFNPVQNRGNWLRRGLEVALGLSRYNRRLHSKAWIADGRMAILGGRNIGDTYFGRPNAGRFSFGVLAPGGSGLPHPNLRPRISRDADVLLSGPAVAEIEAAFDSFWNLGLVLPIQALLPRVKTNLDRFRRQVAQHTSGPEARAFAADLMASDRPDAPDAAQVLTGRLRWAEQVRVLADPPDKAFGRRKSPWMAEQVAAILDGAQDEVCLITPYFVPGQPGMAVLGGVMARGVRLSILTNALAASDNIFVHGAYRYYRRKLLAAGARIFEFAPPRQEGRKRDVLHSKVFVIDGQRAIVGSLNFDLRSAYTNSEIGVVIEDPDLVGELIAIFEEESSPEQSYAVTLTGGALEWQVARPSLATRMTVEPESSRIWRAVSWTVGRLPIHRWL